MMENAANELFERPRRRTSNSTWNHNGAPAQSLHGRRLDDDPRLLDESYGLRYRVYCVERRFLAPDDYPDRRERDEFDRYSLHLGVVDECGTLLATARLVRVGLAGLPLFRHCAIDPHETELYFETNRVVEVSRLCVSRELRSCGADRSLVVTTLYRVLYEVSKQHSFTHWVVATEPSLQRLVTNFGFPFRSIGPTVDYFGPVTPYLMNLAAFDQIVLARSHQALDSFLDVLLSTQHEGAGLSLA